MSIKMIANGGARGMVDKRVPFRGSNVWAEWDKAGEDDAGRYVVYSYTYTWPLYVYDALADVWYENCNQFSKTTSRHRNLCRPSGVQTIPLNIDDMLVVARLGSVGLIEWAEETERMAYAG